MVEERIRKKINKILRDGRLGSDLEIEVSSQNPDVQHGTVTIGRTTYGFDAINHRVPHKDFVYLIGTTTPPINGRVKNDGLENYPQN